MNNQSFTTTILVDQSPEEVFKAITNVRGWWSEEVTGGSEKLNDVFHYQYKDVHSCRIQLTEVVPGKKIVWHVLENHFSFTQDDTEWTGNDMIFEIDRKDNKTQLRFTQDGLVPENECYEACNAGWTNYISTSLRNLIETGKGNPNPKEGGFNAEIVEKLKLEQ